MHDVKLQKGLIAFVIVHNNFVQCNGKGELLLLLYVI